MDSTDGRTQALPFQIKVENQMKNSLKTASSYWMERFYRLFIL